MNIDAEKWFKWRIVTHESLRVGLYEIENRWCLDDVVDAHDVLDEIDDAHRRAAAKR